MAHYTLDAFADGMYQELESIMNSLNEPQTLEWFTNLWENNAPFHEWYPLAATLKPSLTQRQFDIAWQWRVILHEDFEQAKLELANAVFGWY